MDQNFNFQGDFNLQGVLPENFPYERMDQLQSLGQGDWMALTGMAFLSGWMLAVAIIVAIAVYVAIAWSFMRISQKTKIGRSWFAWIPILNVILWLNLGGFSGWYILLFVLFFIPFVNILAMLPLLIFAIYVWMMIAKACKKPDYLGMFALIPGGILILPLYLAFMK